jgi:lathosterol oxidase
MPDLNHLSISPFTYIATEFASHLVRYFGLAITAYVLIWKRKSFLPHKVDPKPVPKNQIRSEIMQSSLTMIIFSIMGGCVYVLNHDYGWFRFYADAHQYGLTYLILSPILLVLLHDTYFYWTHRFMHHPKVFKLVHRVHHQSYSPTPFTSYSFHMLETLIDSLYIPVISLLIPVHLYALIFVVFYSYAINLIGHLGYELYGKWFWNSWMAEVFTTTTFHHYHHLGGPKTNFGFYFRFWDRICQTEDPRYQKVLQNRKQASGLSNADVRTDQSSQLAG